jgi:septal ring factor EnvC (AmiA/AmiB activator)
VNNFRQVREARINFLFFQDIITCVMGILILITLMLSLSLPSGEAAYAEEQQQQTELRQLKQNLADTEQQNRAIEQQALRLASLADPPALEAQLAILKREVDQSAEQLRQSEQTASAAKAQQQAAAAERQSATNLQQTVATLQEQLTNARAALRRQTNALYLVPADDPRETHEPVAFIVNSNKIQIRRFNNTAPQEHTIARDEDIRPVLAALNPAREYVVFYFRPSGVKWFEPFRTIAREAGFAVGYDAVEEQKQMIFSNP